jgi:hypothetical protein
LFGVGGALVILLQDKAKIRKIVETVEKYLEPHQPADYRLVVSPNGIQEEDDWFYVVVEPDRDDVRSYDISHRLVEAESDIEKHTELKILLVPVRPE